MGGFNHICGKSGGEGGVTVFLKKWKIRGGGGGVLSELPSVVGVWIFSGTTQHGLLDIHVLNCYHHL